MIMDFDIINLYWQGGKGMFSSFLYLQKTTKIMTKGKKKEKFVKIHNSEQKLFFFKSRKSCIL